MTRALPDLLYVHPEVRDHPKVRALVDGFAGQVIPWEEGTPPDGWLVTRQKGAFIKPCPGQKGYCCCNLWVLETALGCPFGCEYCALQA